MRRMIVPVVVAALLGAAVIPLYAQNGGNAASRANGAQASRQGAGSLQQVMAELATPDGRIRVLAAMTGIPEAQLKQAEKIYQDAQQEMKTDQAEIDVRKAELTRALIDEKPNMTNVQDLLHQGLDWEYKLRLAQIQRDLRVRQLLGDTNWTEYRTAVQLLDRLVSTRLRGGPASTNRPPANLNRREQALMDRLQLGGPGGQGN